MARNPVMFVVEIGSVLTTIVFLRDLGSATGEAEPLRRARRRLALVHRAVRQLRRGDGRGSGQGPGRLAAQGPRRHDGPRPARRRRGRRRCPARSSSSATSAWSSAGEIIPGDGEIIEGIASVDESAITGESAPVIRESGGDRSAVTGGTRVLSDQIVVRITARPGETFLDRMIALVEGAAARRRRTRSPSTSCWPASPSSSCWPRSPCSRFAIYSGAEQDVIVLVALLVCLIPTTIGALLSAHRHRRHGPPRAAQRAGHVAAGRSRRPATAPPCCSTRPARSRSATARPPPSSQPRA